MQTINTTSRPDIGLTFLDAAALWGSFAKRAMIDATTAASDDAAEWALIRVKNNTRYAMTCARLALSEVGDTYEPAICDACEDAPAVEDFGGMAFCPTCAPQWFVCQRCHEAQQVEGQQTIDGPRYQEVVCMGCYSNWMSRW